MPKTPGDDGAFAAHREPDAPSVIGPGSFGDDEAEDATPTVVYLPIEQPMATGDEHVTVQLRHTDAGELALPVFTSVQRLVASSGEAQAWVKVSTSDLDDIVARAGANAFAVDPALGEGDS